MNLKPTRVEQVYEVGDESGYRFTVVANYDAETGWSASVHLASHGFASPEVAIDRLREPARQFLRQTAEIEVAPT